jgi:Lecithin:cholesterol acyltransferase
MKKNSQLLAFVLLGLTLSAQNNSRPRPMDDMLDAGSSDGIVTTPPIIRFDSSEKIFELLEKQRVPTGILLDYGIETTDLSVFSGSISPINSANITAVKDIYNTLILSRVSDKSSAMVAPDTFAQNWYLSQKRDVLSLGGTLYEYAAFSDRNQETFKALAANTNDNRSADVASESLVITAQNQIKDLYINNIWQNPYEKKKVLAISPVYNSFNKLSFKTIFSKSLLMSNMMDDLAKIEIRFADDQAFQTLNFDQLVEVKYQTEGDYTWTYKVTLKNGETMYSHSKMKIANCLDAYVEKSSQSTKALGRSSSPSDFKIPIDPYINLNMFTGFRLFAKAYLYVKLAPGHSTITKPLIVVEGYDTGHITNPSKESGDLGIEDFLERPAAQKFRNDGYDILYLDWSNGTDAIESNAELLKKAIAWVNALKQGGEKNVVLGQSMGGLIARYALKDMEDQGINHDTKLYISHDAPHLGANTPVALQYMTNSLANNLAYMPLGGIANFGASLFNGPVPNNMLNLSSQPASRQMLINYLNSDYQIDNSVHDAWQQKLKAKGYPQKTRNVAIANGSECGTDQNVQDLVRLYDESRPNWFLSAVISPLIGFATFTPDMLIYSLLPGGKTKYIFNFTVKPMLNLNEDKRLYDASIRYQKKILWFIPSSATIYSDTRQQPKGIYPVDKYGGGKYVSKSLKEASIMKSLDTALFSDFSFIPTPSALDFHAGNKVLTEEDYQRPYSSKEDAHLSPFANFIAERAGDNNSHISFNWRNLDFIDNQLSNDKTRQDQKLSSTYLCGSKIKIGGQSLLCDQVESTYTTGFAPYYQWYASQGADLIDFTSSVYEPQVSFKTKPDANGLVILKAWMGGPEGSSETEKRIWVGKPKIGLEATPTYNRSFFVSVGSPESEQGIRNIQYSPSSKDAVITRYSDNGFQVFGNTRNNPYAWGTVFSATATNDCGTATSSVDLNGGDLPCVDYKVVHYQGDYYELYKSDKCDQSADDGIIGWGYSSPGSMPSRARKKKVNTNSPVPNEQIILAKLYNSQGEEVRSYSNNHFDTEGLLTGVYNLIIKVNGRDVSQKIIVK